MGETFATTVEIPFGMRDTHIRVPDFKSQPHLFQLPIYAYPWKKAMMIQAGPFHLCRRLRFNSGILALAWPNFGWLGHLGSKPEKFKIYLSPSPHHTTACLSAFQIKWNSFERNLLILAGAGGCIFKMQKQNELKMSRKKGNAQQGFLKCEPGLVAQKQGDM